MSPELNFEKSYVDFHYFGLFSYENVKIWLQNQRGMSEIHLDMARFLCINDS